METVSEEGVNSNLSFPDSTASTIRQNNMSNGNESTSVTGSGNKTCNFKINSISYESPLDLSGQSIDNFSARRRMDMLSGAALSLVEPEPAFANSNQSQTAEENLGPKETHGNPLKPGRNLLRTSTQSFITTLSYSLAQKLLVFYFIEF